MTGPSPARRDAGLAAERTQLAWGRNGLALMVCGAALLKRVGPLAASGHRPAAGLLVVTMGLAVWLMGVVYRRRRGAGEVADGASMRLVAYSTAALGVVAMTVAIIPS